MAQSIRVCVHVVRRSTMLRDVSISILLSTSADVSFVIFSYD